MSRVTSIAVLPTLLIVLTLWNLQIDTINCLPEPETLARTFSVNPSQHVRKIGHYLTHDDIVRRYHHSRSTSFNGEGHHGNHCKFNQFKCRYNGICVSMSKRCNGVKDCSDASDEDGCLESLLRRKETTIRHDNNEVEGSNRTTLSVEAAGKKDHLVSRKDPAQQLPTNKKDYEENNPLSDSRRSPSSSSYSSDPSSSPSTSFRNPPYTIDHKGSSFYQRSGILPSTSSSSTPANRLNCQCSCVPM